MGNIDSDVSDSIESNNVQSTKLDKSYDKYNRSKPEGDDGHIYQIFSDCIKICRYEFVFCSCCSTHRNKIREKYNDDWLYEKYDAEYKLKRAGDKVARVMKFKNPNRTHECECDCVEDVAKLDKIIYIIIDYQHDDNFKLLWDKEKGKKLREGLIICLKIFMKWDDKYPFFVLHQEFYRSLMAYK